MSKPTQAHGPYIVSVKQPCPACTHGPAAGGEHRPEYVSRRAVATLEEARRQVWRRVVDAYGRGDHAPWGLRQAWSPHGAPSSSGGTVGPLPDGTVIEVEPVEWKTLAREAGLLVSDHLGGDAIVARWNMAQAEGLMT